MPRDRPLLFYNWIIIGAKFVEKVTEQRKRASGARTATFSNCLDIRGGTRSLAQLTVRARAYVQHIDRNQQPKLEPKMDLIGVCRPKLRQRGCASSMSAIARSSDRSCASRDLNLSGGGSLNWSNVGLRGTRFLPTARHFSPSLARLTEGGYGRQPTGFGPVTFAIGESSRLVLERSDRRADLRVDTRFFRPWKR